MAAKATAKPVPDPLFHRIQEVAKIAGVKPHVLRYWESEFPQLAPRKDMNDQRRYTKKDIDLVLQIKTLLYRERFSAAGSTSRCRYRKTGGFSNSARRNARYARSVFVGEIASSKSKADATSASSRSTWLAARTNARRPKA